jgi:hypothetical protein
MGMLRHRPHESSIAVVSLCYEIKTAGGVILIYKKGTYRNKKCDVTGVTISSKYLNTGNIGNRYLLLLKKHVIMLKILFILVHLAHEVHLA